MSNLINIEITGLKSGTKAAELQQFPQYFQDKHPNTFASFSVKII